MGTFYGEVAWESSAAELSTELNYGNFQKGRCIEEQWSYTD